MANKSHQSKLLGNVLGQETDKVSSLIFTTELDPASRYDIRNYVYSPSKNSFEWLSETWDEKERKKLKARAKKQVKTAFFGREAYENLEVEPLEAMIGGWEKQKYENHRYELSRPYKWGTLGLSLLNYFIRSPIRKPESLKYIQDGVRELAEKPEIRKKLTDILIREEGLFRTSKAFGEIKNDCYRVQAFGNYQTSLEEVATLLRETESNCLRNVSKLIDRLLGSEALKIATEIAKSSIHNFRVTGGKTKEIYGPEKPVHSIEYVLNDGSTINCFTIRDGVLDDDRNGKFNAYQVVWTAIEKTLAKTGFDSLKDVAFAGAILGYLNGLASFG